MAMTVVQTRLWNELESLLLDDPTHAPPFTERLREEHGWSAAFASRVVHEYRRFLLLAATEESITVPSDAVDQAWHLHLVDTHAYWDGLCSTVMCKALHHTPSRGGMLNLNIISVDTRRRCFGITQCSTRKRQRTSGRHCVSDSADVLGGSIVVTPG